MSVSVTPIFYISPAIQTQFHGDILSSLCCQYLRTHAIKSIFFTGRLIKTWQMCQGFGDICYSFWVCISCRLHFSFFSYGNKEFKELYPFFYRTFFSLKTEIRLQCPKGQLISKCPIFVFELTKKPTKLIFLFFLIIENYLI